MPKNKFTYRCALNLTHRQMFTCTSQDKLDANRFLTLRRKFSAADEEAPAMTVVEHYPSSTTQVWTLKPVGCLIECFGGMKLNGRLRIAR